MHSRLPRLVRIGRRLPQSLTRTLIQQNIYPHTPTHTPMRAHEFGSNTTPGGLTQTHLNQYHGIIITTTTSRNGQAGQLADSDPKVFLYYTLKIFRRTNSTFVMSLSLSTVMVFVTFWVRFNNVLIRLSVDESNRQHRTRPRPEKDKGRKHRFW